MIDTSRDLSKNITGASREHRGGAKLKETLHQGANVKVT